MKITFFALFFLFTTAAFGQATGTISGDVSPLRIVGHPQHAYQQAMASEQVLLEQSTYTSAKGERPLWEVAPEWHATPLGDIARELKQEHATAKKAEIVWEN